MKRSREITPDERVTEVKPSAIFARQAFVNLVQLPQNLTANRPYVRASSLQPAFLLRRLLRIRSDSAPSNGK